MKCLNFNCNNELTQNDENNQSIKFNKYRVCLKCRKQIHKIESIKCAQCHTRIPLNMQKIYCDGCKRERKNEYHRSRHVKQYVKKTSNYEILEETLKSGNYVKLVDLADSIQTHQKRIFPFIGYLKKAKGLNIVTYYRLERLQ